MIIQDANKAATVENEETYTEFGAPDDVAEYIADLSFQLYEMAVKGGLREVGDLLKASSTLARQKAGANRTR